MRGKTLKFSSIITAWISYMKTRLNSIYHRKNAILSYELDFSDRNFDKKNLQFKLKKRVSDFRPSIIFIFIYIFIEIELKCCSIGATSASTVTTGN